MKEVFVQYAEYNLWANSRMMEVINAMPQEKQSAEITSSFSSVYATLLHMWHAESVWWQRLKMSEQIVAPQEVFKGTISELSDNFLKQNRQWKDYVMGIKDHTLHHEFIYKNSKRESFKQPVYQLLMHLFNHGTYHRGQLVTMLRQLGVTNIPATDFIVWSRKK